MPKFLDHPLVETGCLHNHGELIRYGTLQGSNLGSRQATGNWNLHLIKEIKWFDRLSGVKMNLVRTRRLVGAKL